MTKYFVSSEEYHLLIDDVFKALSQNNVKFDLVVGVSRGGLIPAVHLSHRFDVPMETLTVKSYHGTCQQEPEIYVSERTLLAICRSRQVLIIDDIVDTGSTFKLVNNYLIDRTALKGFACPSIKYLSLTHKDNHMIQDLLYYSSKGFDRKTWIEFYYENTSL